MTTRRATRRPSVSRRLRSSPWTARPTGRRRPLGAGGGLSRRRLLGWTGAGVALAGVGAAAGYAVGTPAAEPAPAGVVPFRGMHQAGIITPAQDRLHFVALDLTTDRPRPRCGPCCGSGPRPPSAWSPGAETTPGRRGQPEPGRAADRHRRGARAARGRRSRSPSASARRCSTSWASARCKPAGLGRAAAVHLRPDRPGAVRRRPVHPGLRRRPAGRRARGAQPGPDGLRHHRGALVAARVRAHRRRRRPRRPRRATCSASRTAPTTSRPRSPTELDEHVWVQPGDGPAWLDGGSYLVARRIRMHIEIWDRTSLPSRSGWSAGPRATAPRWAAARSSTWPTTRPCARTGCR